MSSDNWYAVEFVSPGTLPPAPPMLNPPATLTDVNLLARSGGCHTPLIPISSGATSFGGCPRKFVGRMSVARNELTMAEPIRYVSPTANECVFQSFSTG